MKNYTEQEIETNWSLVPNPVKQRVMAVLTELDRACLKFPSFPTDKVDQAAIVCEESGELIRAALQYKYENGKEIELTKEAIQTGAMALRVLIHLPLQAAPEKWIKEIDTQVIEKREPQPGEYTCINPYTNELGYVYMTDSKLIVKRYNALYDAVICQLPDEDTNFRMKLDELLDHFVKTDMIL